MIIKPKDNLNDSISPKAREDLNRFLAKKWNKINLLLAEKQRKETEQRST